MRYTLKAPERLKATVTLPASKSISNRALIISALSGNIVTPQNLSDCDDTNVTVRALRDMPYEIDIMASGTAMRFMTAYLSVTGGACAHGDGTHEAPPHQGAGGCTALSRCRY